MYLKRILTYSILSLIAIGGYCGNISIDTNLMSGTGQMMVSYEANGVYAADTNAAATPPVTADSAAATAKADIAN